MVLACWVVPILLLAGLAVAILPAVALGFDLGNDARSAAVCPGGAVCVNHDAWVMYRVVAIMSYAVPALFACTKCCYRRCGA